MKVLLGALLARLAEAPRGGFSDVRFAGVDAAILMIFGERQAPDPLDPESRSRLHRAALVG